MHSEVDTIHYLESSSATQAHLRGANFTLATRQPSKTHAPPSPPARRSLAATTTGNAIKNFVLANVDMQCVTLQALHACITNTHTYNYIATLSLHCYFYALLALCYADLSVVVTICVLCCSCYSTLHI